jgi:Fe-S-cluster-containing dehydrogenase component
MSDTKQDREGFLEKATSRLDFLKVTGVGLAGAFVALTMGCATTVRSRDGKELRVWALPAGALVHDPNRCVACKRCEAICTVRNDGKASAYISRVKVSRNLNFGVAGVSAAYAKADGQLGNFRIVAETCRQCTQPACGDACPAGAIVADKATGARVVNAKKCVGCGSCQAACPWHIATLDPETRVSTKCTTCEGSPTCAKACPTGALALYPYAEAEKLLWGSDAVSGATA